MPNGRVIANRNLAPTSFLSGTFNVSNGSASVSTTASQVSILFPGNTVVFGGGTATGNYIISTVTSSGITLTANYTGTSASTATATNLYAAPNCVLWLRGDLGITLSGSSVTNWNDQSGGSRNFAQATGGKQPTYVTNAQNNLPGVLFDGTNFFMTTSSWASASVQTIVIAWLDNGTSAASAGAFGASGAPGVVYDSTDKGWVADGGTAGTSTTCANSAFIHSSSFPTGTYNVSAFSYGYGGTGATTYATKSFNNGVCLTDLHGTSQSVSNITVPGSAYNIGSRTGAAGTFKGTILEIAVYSSELTPGQVRAVANYMAARYAIPIMGSNRSSIVKQNTVTVGNLAQNITALSGTFTVTNGGTALSGTFAVTAGTTLSGTFNVTNGQGTSGTPIPTTSNQTAALVVGSTIQFGSQAGTNYVIASVTATQITLTTNYTGTTNAATTGTNQPTIVNTTSSQVGVFVTNAQIYFSSQSATAYLTTVASVTSTSITLTAAYTGTNAAAATAVTPSMIGTVSNSATVVPQIGNVIVSSQLANAYSIVAISADGKTLWAQATFTGTTSSTATINYYGVGTGWGGLLNAAIQSNVVTTTAPDGTFTASQLQTGANALQTRVSLSPTGLPASFDNKVYTVSTYAKSGNIESGGSTGRYFYFKFIGNANSNQIVWDLLTGNVTIIAAASASNQSHVGTGQIYAGNGWWRVWMVFLYNANPFAGLGVGTLNGVQYSNSDGSGYIYLWGTQINAGFGPATPTLTTGTANKLSTYSTLLSGTFTVTAGSNSVTTSSSQVGIIIEGNTITFGGGTATGTYVVTAITSTILTLNTNYTGVGTSTATATLQNIARAPVQNRI